MTTTAPFKFNATQWDQFKTGTLPAVEFATLKQMMDVVDLVGKAHLNLPSSPDGLNYEQLKGAYLEVAAQVAAGKMQEGGITELKYGETGTISTGSDYGTLRFEYRDGFAKAHLKLTYADEASRPEFEQELAKGISPVTMKVDGQEVPVTLAGMNEVPGSNPLAEKGTNRFTLKAVAEVETGSIIEVNVGGKTTRFKHL